jgi:hypothetical protein
MPGPLCFDADDELPPPPPPPSGGPKHAKRLRSLDDDDDLDEPAAAVVVAVEPPTKRPRVEIPPTAPAKRHTFPTKKKQQSTPSNSSNNTAPPGFLEHLSRSSPPSLSALCALPESAVFPASRPTAPEPVPLSLDLDTPNVQKDIDEVRKHLSETARRILETMIRLNPHVKKRHRDAKTGHTIPHIKETELKRAMRPHIRVNTFAHEQQLMYFANCERESPLRPGFKFKARACANGDKCIGYTYGTIAARERLLNGTSGAPAAVPFTPGPFMQYHSPEELLVLYTTGAPPAAHTDCLSCLRYVFCDVAIYASGSAEAWGQSTILQSFGNTIGGVTGYAPECCLLPSCGGPFNGLVFPIVQERQDRLYRDYDRFTKGHYIDQRGLASAECKFGEDYPRDIWAGVRAAQLAAASAVSPPQDFQKGAAATTTTMPAAQR